MKNLLTLLAILLVVSAVSAQTGTAKIEKEILNLRSEIRQAVKTKDASALEKYFAEAFTHTHASGKVDDKKQRIAFFVKGEASIEDVEPDEIRFNIFNKNVVSVNGKTTLLFGTEKRTFQWTAVYVKQKGKWQTATTIAVLLKI